MGGVVGRPITLPGDVHEIFLGVGLSLVLMVVVSYVTSEPDEEHLAPIFDDVSSTRQPVSDD